MPTGPPDSNAGEKLSYQLPRLAKQDTKFITSNLFGEGQDVQENPPAEQSRQMARDVKKAVQRLKQKKTKSAKDVQLLKRIKTECGKYY